MILNRTRRWWYRRLAEITALAIAVNFVLRPQFSKSTAITHALTHIDRPWLVLLIIAEAASLVLFAVTTRVILPSAQRPTMSRMLRIDLSAIAARHSVPAGSAAGTALGVRLMADADVPIPDASFARIAHSLGSAIVLQLLLAVGLVISLLTEGMSRQSLALLAVMAIVGGVIAAVFVLLSRSRERLARMCNVVGRRMPGHRDDAGTRLVHCLGGCLDSLLADRRRMALAAVWSVGNWLMDIVALWAAIRALGHSPSLPALIVPFGIASMLSWIPITPGGLGIVEGSLVPLLIGAGTGRSIAALSVLLWRLVAFWAPIPLGGLAYASLASSGRRHPKLARVYEVGHALPLPSSLATAVHIEATAA